MDSVRGPAYFLQSNTTNAEQATGGGDVSSFNSNGFTLSYNNTRDNQNGTTYVAWQWRANGNGITNINNRGSIVSQTSVNASAGFSIVTYTGNATVSTVGHGLGVVPSFIIVKGRTNAVNWQVYHAALGINYSTQLDLVNASANIAGYWGAASPTATTFGIIDSYSGVNSLGVNYVAYCWAAIAGFSVFGNYTGNGLVDGPFVYCGFRPRFILIKDSTIGTSNWEIHDTSRDTYNQAVNSTSPNTTAVESIYASSQGLDILSNGFKIRLAGAPLNTNTDNFIYAAFAENPFSIARAR
jgi:hypothetical protein